MMRKILDPCCGPKTWLRGNKDRFITSDLLASNTPHVVADMKNLPYTSGVFDAIRFDPPHLIRNDVKHWSPQYLRYGNWKNRKEWEIALDAVNKEFYRVTKNTATLLVKIIDGKDRRVTKRADLDRLTKWEMVKLYETPAKAAWNTNVTLWAWFRKKMEHANVS